MNLLLEKSESRISAKIPRRMKQLIASISEGYNMSESQYIKLAINERLEKDVNG
jgi:hypothetical protein